MILMLAPAPNMALGSAPSGASYVSDQYSLVRIANDSAADQIYLQGAACFTLTPFGGYGDRTFTLLTDLYAADTGALFPGIMGYPQYTGATVTGDGGNTGTWAKTGTGLGSGNWTQVTTNTFYNAEAAVTEAQNARDQAYGASRMYATLDAALAATSDDEYFTIPSNDATFATLYQNQTGTAVQVNLLASKLATDRLITSAQAATIIAMLNAITADPANAVTQMFVQAKAFDQGESSGAVYKGAPSAANTSRLCGWSLPHGVKAYISLPIRVPSHWASATVEIEYVNESSSAGNVSLGAGNHDWANGDSIDVTPPTILTVSGAAPSTAWVAGKLITTALSVNPSKTTTLRIQRNGDSGSDTLNGNITVVSVTLTKAS